MHVFRPFIGIMDVFRIAPIFLEIKKAWSDKKYVDRDADHPYGKGNEKRDHKHAELLVTVERMRLFFLPQER